MTISLDPSQPGFVPNTGDPPFAQSPLFSPPGNSLLVASVTCLQPTGVINVSISDTQDRVWTLGTAYIQGQLGCAIWTTPLTAAPGFLAVAVEGTPGYDATLMLNVSVLPGASVSQSGAASDTLSSAAGFPSRSVMFSPPFTTTEQGSWAFWCGVGDSLEQWVTLNGDLIQDVNYQDQNLFGTHLAGHWNVQNDPVFPYPGPLGFWWTFATPCDWVACALEILSGDRYVGPATDAGSGTDATRSVVPVYAYTSGDAAKGVGAHSSTARVQSADAGTGSDAGSVPRAWYATNTSLIYVGSIPATGPLACPQAIENGKGTGTHAMLTGRFPVSADTGLGGDSSLVLLPYGWNVGDYDTGTGLDVGAGSPVLPVSDSDVAAGCDGNAVPQSLAQSVSSVVIGAQMEGFSLDRCAVLDTSGPVAGTGTGSESLHLYAAQAITITPDITTSDMQADDNEYGTWYTLNKAAITVTNGFMSFNSVAQLAGTSVAALGSSPADYYALPLWTQYSHNQPCVPMAFRMMSRDSSGDVRTLTFVLYKVQLAVLDFTGTVYKSGLVVNYAGTVLFSSYDEYGNALSGPEIGRIVSLPGTQVGHLGQVQFSGV